MTSTHPLVRKPPVSVNAESHMHEMHSTITNQSYQWPLPHMGDKQRLSGENRRVRSSGVFLGYLTPEFQSKVEAQYNVCLKRELPADEIIREVARHTHTNNRVVCEILLYHRLPYYRDQLREALARERRTA